MSDNQPNTGMILLIIVVFLAFAGALAALGFSTLARHGVRCSDLGIRLRAGATLAGGRIIEGVETIDEEWR